MNHGYRALLVLLLFLTTGGAAASTHSLLDRSQPADGEVLKSVPRTVHLWFTEALESKVATVRLLDGAGKPVPGTVQTAQGGALLALSLPPLSAGTYSVEWSALSEDSHVTLGKIGFTALGPSVAGNAQALAAERAPGPLVWRSLAAGGLLLVAALVTRRTRRAR